MFRFCLKIFAFLFTFSETVRGGSLCSKNPRITSYFKLSAYKIKTSLIAVNSLYVKLTLQIIVNKW